MIFLSEYEQWVPYEAFWCWRFFTQKAALLHWVLCTFLHNQDSVWSETLSVNTPTCSLQNAIKSIDSKDFWIFSLFMDLAFFNENGHIFSTLSRSVLYDPGLWELLKYDRYVSWIKVTLPHYRSQIAISPEYFDMNRTSPFLPNFHTMIGS